MIQLDIQSRTKQSDSTPKAPTPSDFDSATLVLGNIYSKMLLFDRDVANP